MTIKQILAATWLYATMVTLAWAQSNPLCAGYGDAAHWATDKDAVASAPQNHRVVMENDLIRVLEVTVPPGTREANHHHRWPSVLLIDSRPPYINYDKDGHAFKSVIQAQPSADLPLAVRLAPQAEHAIENTGDKPFHAIRIEYKTLCNP